MKNKHRLLFFLTAMTALILATVLGTSAQNSNQQPAGGGGTSDAAVPKKSPAPKPNVAAPNSTKPRGKPVATSPRSSSVTTGDINGKWWTSGNDFGKSVVVFTQEGNHVLGSITYADGRTGNLTGVFAGKRLNYTWTNSSGDQGTGWLEQSWANFLGGSWRGRSVKDGSWTLNRIEGNWCFGGLRTRIRKVTHNAQGDLRYVTEDGDCGGGHLEGPYIFLDDDTTSLKGDMYFKANRIDFAATGAYWTWCGR